MNTPPFPGASERIGAVRRGIAHSLLFASALLLASTSARPQVVLRAVTDNISYNVGETVRLRIAGAAAGQSNSARDYRITLRYMGESKPLLDRAPLALLKSSAAEDEYRDAWKVPTNARTGRYEIDLVGLDPKTHQETLSLKSSATFAVHRQRVRIERIDLGKTFYTPGDPVSCRAVLRNLTDRPLHGLRVEFSERYWPWIAQTADRAGVDVFPMVKDLTLKPGTELEVRSASAAVARNVTRPTVQQYAVVVWDSSRQTVYDIAFSSLTFIQPPGTSSEKPYPLQYVFPDLASVDTSSYRQFERPPFGSTAIRFDRSRTMYEPGDIATVKFTVTNNTDRLWDKVIVRTSLRALGRAEFAKQVLGEDVDVPPRGGRIEQAAKFTLPSDGPGSYRAVVEVSTKAGDVLAAGEIELAANSLPKSILIFCAHEDDEGAHAGMIRAAVENEIPIQIVYITGGDSGSCDRYYEHSCSPAEALNFGVLRMDEARASLAHLGVPRENVHFLGLPDGGSGEIWFKHVEPANPYLSVLLATDHAPYEDIENPNLPYSRKSAVEAAKAFIKQYKPEVIYTGHPDERHVDHRTNNWFVVKAMQELLHGGVISTDVKLLVDQSYGPGPQKHAPYRYEKNILNVSPEVWARAQEARWFYQSQSGNRDLGKIRSLDKLLRQEIHWQVLDWNEHEGWNEKE